MLCQTAHFQLHSQTRWKTVLWLILACQKERKKGICRYFKALHSKYVHNWEHKACSGVLSVWTGEFLSTCLSNPGIQPLGVKLNLARPSQALCVLLDRRPHSFQLSGCQNPQLHLLRVSEPPAICQQAACLATSAPSSYSSFRADCLKRHLMCF